MTPACERASPHSNDYLGVSSSTSLDGSPWRLSHNPLRLLSQIVLLSAHHPTHIDWHGQDTHTHLGLIHWQVHSSPHQRLDCNTLASASRPFLRLLKQGPNRLWQHRILALRPSRSTSNLAVSPEEAGHRLTRELGSYCCCCSGHRGYQLPAQCSTQTGRRAGGVVGGKGPGPCIGRTCVAHLG